MEPSCGLTLSAVGVLGLLQFHGRALFSWQLVTSMPAVDHNFAAALTSNHSCWYDPTYMRRGSRVVWMVSSRCSVQNSLCCAHCCWDLGGTIVHVTSQNAAGAAKAATRTSVEGKMQVLSDYDKAFATTQGLTLLP